jgi:hypothetical protein
MSQPIRIESKTNTALNFLSNIQFDKVQMKQPSFSSPTKKFPNSGISPRKSNKENNSKEREALSFLSNIKTKNEVTTPSVEPNPQDSPPKVKLRTTEVECEKFEKIELKDKVQEKSLRVTFTLKGVPFVSSFFQRIQTNKEIIKKKEEISYQDLFSKTPESYDPTFLDDPLMGIGNRRTVMNLPGFLCSTIPFVKKSEVMDDLDETFAEDHPDIASQITLSEIRSLKEQLYNSVRLKKEFLVEVGTIAVALVYLEKLIIKGFLNKQNKNLVSAVCLILATKFNEHKKNWIEFFDELEDAFGISKKKIIEMEWIVYSEELEFNLFVSNVEVYPHLRHLLFTQGLTLEEFLESM